jgi:hypothetical protein
MKLLKQDTNVNQSRKTAAIVSNSISVEKQILFSEGEDANDDFSKFQVFHLFTEQATYMHHHILFPMSISSKCC